LSLERLELTPFASLISPILVDRRSGVLTIMHRSVRRDLHWALGELVLITTSAPPESLAGYLVYRKLVAPEQARGLDEGSPLEIVPRFYEGGIVDVPQKQAILRDWMMALSTPFFSLDEGTAVFSEDAPLDPEKRIFLPSMPSFVLAGVRSIANGLVLRRCLGDMKREIAMPSSLPWDFDLLPLTHDERAIATALQERETIEAFLKRFHDRSNVAARVVISMMVIGMYETVDPTSHSAVGEDATMQKDMALLAALGGSDPRSLRAVALSRQLKNIDYYTLLDVPKAATRAQIGLRADEMTKLYDPASFPALIRDSIEAIRKGIEAAADVLKDSVKRHEYDHLLAKSEGTSHFTIQQRLARRSIAERNFAKATDLVAEEDYYGAIVLLKQTVGFAPDHSEAWYLLASCQQRNPKWLRDAAESYHKALSFNPNHVDAMISLGDLYRSQGLTARAQSCYEDAIVIEPENVEAKNRLKALKK
jgi:tetratricopeptide (TPR) repeat protein